MVMTDIKDVSECGVANITSGKQCGWFKKMKNDSAKAKWLSDNNSRFFTVDFDDRTVYYANSETQSKTVSNPIAFRDIVQVKLLERKLQRGLTERLFGAGEETTCGFSLITCDREIRLLCKTQDDAKKWVSIFNAAQRLGLKGHGIAKSPSRNSLSTEPGSDESPPPSSDTDSGDSGCKNDQGLRAEPTFKPFQDNLQLKPFGVDMAKTAGYGHGTVLGMKAMQEQPSWMTPTPEPGSKPEVFFEPDASDAFAALDALQEDLGPVPTAPLLDASKVDIATVKAAKAKRTQKKIEKKQQNLSFLESFGSPPKRQTNHNMTKDGYGQPQQPTPAPMPNRESEKARNANKEMSAEDRNARDIALLQKVQMPHRSSKAKADDAPPLKATRPMKRPSAWEENGEGCKAKMTSLTAQGWVSTNVQLEGAAMTGKAAKDDDTNSWDGDAEEVQPASAWVVGNDDNSWDGSGDERAAQKAKKSKAAKSAAKNKEVIYEPATSKDDDPWDSDDDKKKGPPVPKSFCGPSEGKVDHSSWDDDEPAPAVMKKAKSVKKKVEMEDEDDPTAGLDELLDGKEVAIPVHQYVDGFQCTQCDFKVIRFQGFEWSPKAEYLFFRNYYGKPKKLKSRVIAKPGHSAYCCQCAFKSVPSDMDLRDVKDNTRWKVVSA
eukprot:gnl/MRDRNA2_/MRDRNA2_96802_c0_seq1.p1 gnl/MRDRNA2_/MRDRNA2_96802_c0~~gnl/MRDRNA2_/MRDRNA2_96802_c0_seq1.p1  ORF type:complete len:659 (+),score=159.29 gnl/MRDRNA2_/MRDRNA2_96802_c0_seq1:128-2104(+)